MCARLRKLSILGKRMLETEEIMGRHTCDLFYRSTLYNALVNEEYSLVQDLGEAYREYGDANELMRSMIRSTLEATGTEGWLTDGLSTENE